MENSLEVLAEERHWIVVNKPHGLQTEPDKNSHTNLLEMVEQYLKTHNKWNQNARIIPVTRLDRPVGGLVLLALRKTMAARLQNLLETHQIRKTYRALVLGSLPADQDLKFKHYLKKDSGKFKSIITNRKVDKFYKQADLQYKVKAKVLDEWTEIEVNIGTGRYHQIRAQMAFLGLPIWNDVLYGSKCYSETVKIGLVCDSIEVNLSPSETAINVRLDQINWIKDYLKQ